MSRQRHRGGVDDGFEEMVDLVAAVRSGDGEAFAALYRRCHGDAERAVSRILRNPHDTAEIVQDVLMRVWERLDDLEDPGAFLGWLRRICRNRALNRLRDRRWVQSVDGDEIGDLADRHSGAAVFPDPQRALEARTDREIVWSAGAGLAERDRQVLRLHVRSGMGAGEIARELGISPNLASQLLHRMRRRLRSAIDAHVLWHGGVPACPDLAEALPGQGSHPFDPDLVRTVTRHAQGCPVCREILATSTPTTVRVAAA